MKRFYTLALGLMMGATTLFAQKTTDLQFVTITGEGDEAVETGTVKDGAAIDATEETFQGIASGVALKNVSGSDQKIVVKSEVLELDNGAFSFCMGSTCSSWKKTGTYYKPTLKKENDDITGGFTVIKSKELKDIEAHWVTNGKGKCVVKFTAYKGVVDEEISDSEWKVYNLVEGPSVTVNFLNGVPSSISNIENKDVDNNYYDLAGRKVAKPTKGIYVKNNKKVVVK